jgi:ribosomal protein S18 acetylase RimI-like enzyme
MPEWDGLVRPVLGIGTPEGSVISVPFSVLDEAIALAELGFAAMSAAIGALFGRPHVPLGVYDFRYLRELVALEPLGEWVQAEDPRTPAWLRPFNGGVLIVCDGDDRYMAGVGLKLHDEFASEIAVGTEPEFRGRGLARRLVATASRHLVEEGKTATYEHVPSNDRSGAVAIAAGFSDSGWTTIHLGNEE